MVSLNEIRKRIKAVESTAKITNAMKLVATSKLKKQKEMFINQSEYYQKFYDIFSYIKHHCENKQQKLNKNTNGKTIWVAIFSGMGLCASFNLNIAKELINHLKKEDQLWLLGKKGTSILKARNVTNEISININLEDKDVNYDLFYIIANNLIRIYYTNNDVSAIKVIYTKFVNSLTFYPTIFSLFPLDDKINESRLDKPNHGGEYTLEPDADDLFESILNDYIATCIYGSVVESKVCENASRRNAMDSATKNANELINNYKLEFNRKRQADITQEITEIISGTEQGV